MACGDDPNSQKSVKILRTLYNLIITCAIPTGWGSFLKHYALYDSVLSGLLFFEFFDVENPNRFAKPFKRELSDFFDFDVIADRVENTLAD